MAETATIRVTRETRDLLSEQARERGQSLAAMLTDIAEQFRREVVFRAERNAARRDAEAAEAREEEREWESSLADGVD